MINDQMIMGYMSRYFLTSVVAVMILFLGWKFIAGLTSSVVSPPTCTLDTLKIGDAMSLRGNDYVISKINSYGRSGAMIELDTND